jgi:hypothetical protein
MKNVMQVMISVKAKATVAAFPKAVTPGAAMLSIDSGIDSLVLKAAHAMAPLIAPLISAPMVESESRGGSIENFIATPFFRKSVDYLQRPAPGAKHRSPILGECPKWVKSPMKRLISYPSST